MNKFASVRTDDGYTLIELLVVLLLVGFIVTAVSAGLTFGTRVWERSESRISQDEATDAAQSILRNLLSSATPRMEDGAVRLHGEPFYLAFDALPPTAFGASGFSRIELSLVSGGGGTNLLVRISSLIDRKKVRQAQLAERLVGLRFAYLDTSEKVPVWLDFWRDRPRLPDAVRLQAGAGSGDWPSFVARLPIKQDSRCDFDAVSAECRRQ